MKCPVCKKHSLSVTTLIPDLDGRVCSVCNGIWVARNKYDSWRKRLPANIPETASDTVFSVTDTRGSKICPLCSHILLPYRVGHGLSFSIDYCSACGGIWFDHNKWDALKARNLHANLHNIVSDRWQIAVRRADAETAIEQKYKRMLGEEYEKAAEIRNWIRNHPKRTTLLIYLNDVQKTNR